MSLYFDESLAHKVTKRAKRENVSVSKYVSDIIRSNMDGEWADDFLSSLGSIKSDSFKRPAQPDFALDSKRETI